MLGSLTLSDTWGRWRSPTLHTHLPLSLAQQEEHKLERSALLDSDVQSKELMAPQRMEEGQESTLQNGV